jgi:hypothetical protein
LCSRENDADLRQKDTGKITPVSYVPWHEDALRAEIYPHTFLTLELDEDGW